MGTHHFEEIKPFDISVKYTELLPQNHIVDNDIHIHSECEVYINMSGDVSFVVEDSIYPVKYGDIIVTRPFEYHHCIHHSNKLHRHFWILFSCKGNEQLFGRFFDRAAGRDNLLTLCAHDTNELMELCHRMADNTNCLKHLDFFKFIELLQNASVSAPDTTYYPQDITYAIRYINLHFDESLSVADIAKDAGVSINTLERHFLKAVSLTPTEYIQSKRLANAAKLLSLNYSVTDASQLSGFPDYSGFIALFKKHYGVTPLKYKKGVLQSD